jgi:putative FmdB family regulatory protein
MPIYEMKCKCGATTEIYQAIESDETILCPVCGGKMWRKPQKPNVNWGGLRPSQGEHAPWFQNRVDNIERIKDETDAKWKERESWPRLNDIS